MDQVEASALIEQRKVAAAPTGEVGKVLVLPAGNKVQIDCSGTTEWAWCPIEVGYTIAVGDLVRVVRSGMNACVVGRIAGRLLPPTGTVTAAPGGATAVTVTDGTQSFTLPFLASYSPVVGNQVAMLWQFGSGLILGRLGAVPVPPPPPPPPAPPAPGVPPPPVPPAPPPSPPVTGTSTFQAADARSYRSGWRTDSAVVAQGSYGSYGANSGAWFYANQPAASLAGATVTGCSIYLTRRSGGVYAGQTIHLYRHTSPTRPAGDVSRVAGPNDVSLAVGESGWFDLPTAWGQAMVDSGHGIGITGSPYVNLTGLDEDPQSGLIRLNWSR